MLRFIAACCAALFCVACGSDPMVASAACVDASERTTARDGLNAGRPDHGTCRNISLPGASGAKLVAGAHNPALVSALAGGELFAVNLSEAPCVLCAAHLNDSLARNDAISAMAIDEERQVLFIVADNDLGDAEISAAMRKAGFEIVHVERGDEAVKRLKAAEIPQR